MKNLSVLVPFYNEEATLELSINRLIDCNIAEKIILINDCSTDNSLEIANNLVKKYKEIGLRLSSPEGMSNGDWVLIDANDILVHIFRPEVRDFYSLEKMWEKKQDNISSDAAKK